MADAKVSALTALTAPIATDIMEIVDDPGGSPISKKITLLNLLKGLFALVATLAGDAATGANTTPISLTGLVWTYEVNATYLFWWIGAISPAAATTGCGFQLDCSSAITEIEMSFFHQLAVAGTLTGGSSFADDASSGVSSGTPAASVVPVVGFGMLRTTGNTGTAQLRFRSETTAVITAKAGLTLVVMKVAG